MRKISFIVIAIFVLMCCNALVYPAYGVCVDDCKEECNTSIDKKYKWGEGYLEGIGSRGARKGLSDLGETKRQEKEKCYSICNDTCAQNAKDNKTE